MKKEIRAIVICLITIIFLQIGCSAREISKAIDDDLGTNTSTIADQVDNMLQGKDKNIDYAKQLTDWIRNVSDDGTVSEIEIDRSNNANESTMYVHFIDVGQGDSILIMVDGEAMLIDAGDDSKGTFLQNYLKKQGVERFKYIVATHPDADHIGGLDVILTKFVCERVIMPDISKDTAAYRDVMSALKNTEIDVTTPYAGDIYPLGSAYITILAPINDYGDNINNYSIVLLISHGDNKFMFTGDAEAESEKDICDSGYGIQADVLKVGHHGSRSSTTEEFLNKVDPEYAVISCGEKNDYGHPHAETLNNLRSRKIKVFRTDEQGTIIAISDSKGITFSASPSETWIPGE